MFDLILRKRNVILFSFFLFVAIITSSFFAIALEHIEHCMKHWFLDLILKQFRHICKFDF